MGPPLRVVSELQHILSTGVFTLYVKNSIQFIAVMMIWARNSIFKNIHLGWTDFADRFIKGVFKHLISQAAQDSDDKQVYFLLDCIEWSSTKNKLKQKVTVQYLEVIMRKILVSFATDEFKMAQNRLNHAALKYGFDEVRPWGKAEIMSTPFYREHQAILDCPRGAGYWLWKPYIILDALQNAQDNDIICYIDSGAEIIADFSPLINLCIAKGIILFDFDDVQYLNQDWTKRDCFILMNCDSEKVHQAPQINAAFQLYKCNDESQRFIQEYLSYCCDPRIITDAPNVCGQANLPSFRDHRHDQSVVSLLGCKYNIETFRNPCSNKSVKQNSSYTRLINHHRVKANPVDRFDVFWKSFNLSYLNTRDRLRKVLGL